MICTAKRQEAVRELTIDVLVNDAIKNIPVCVDAPVAGGVQTQVEVGIDATEERADKEGELEQFEMARDGVEEAIVSEV